MIGFNDIWKLIEVFVLSYSLEFRIKKKIFIQKFDLHGEVNLYDFLTISIVRISPTPLYLILALKAKNRSITFDVD